MSAAEQILRVRLRDLPEVQKIMGEFNTPEFWDAYDAVTGLRQTRLDSKDLPPYTLNRSKRDTPPEPPKGMLEKLKAWMK